MTVQTNPEKNFTRSTWLVMILAAVLLLYAVLSLAYYLNLPTDGWMVNEPSELPGKYYIDNVMGSASALQPGDRVAAVEGIPVARMDQLSTLAGSWRVGATIEYTVMRGEQEIRIPVTLIKWQIQKWLLNILLKPARNADTYLWFLLLGLAVFIVLRQSQNLAARAFLLMMAAFTSATLGDISPKGIGTWVDPLARLLVLKVELIMLVALLPFVLLQFALVFPRPKPIYERHPWIPYAVGATGLILFLASSEIPLAWFWLIFSIFLTVGILIHNAFTMRDAVSQAQLRWGLGGLIFNFGLSGLALMGNTIGLFKLSPLVFNDFFSLISVIGQSVMGVSLAVAITRYRLFDIDLIIRRTLQYTLLSGLLALVYFGGVTVLQSIFTAVTGQQSAASLVLSTLAIAALFNPLRSRIQDFIDRRFYRQKYDAEKALAEFAETARQETDLQGLTGKLVDLIGGTLQPASLNLWIKSGLENTPRKKL